MKVVFLIFSLNTKAFARAASKTLHSRPNTLGYGIILNVVIAIPFPVNAP